MDFLFISDSEINFRAVQVIDQHVFKINFCVPGSGCGSVGRAGASGTRDPWLKSRYRRNLIYQLYTRNDNNNEKEAGNGPFLKLLYSIRTF